MPKTVDADYLIGKLMHPLQVAIIEAAAWIDEPLSPVLLERSLGEKGTLPNVAYHVRRLAELGVLKEIGQRPVRGAVEHFYELQYSES